MAAINIETAAKLAKQHNTIYWKVTDKTKKLIINRNDDAINIDDSIDLLTDTLNSCIGDFVCVTLYTIKPEQLEKGSTRGKSFDLVIQLKSHQQHTNNNSISGNNFALLLEMQKKINDLEWEKRMDEVTANQGKTSAIEKLIEKVTEGNNINLLISAFMNRVNKQPSTAENIGAAPDDMKETFEKLSKVDPQYKNTLKKMAEYLEANPSVLTQIKMVIGA